MFFDPGIDDSALELGLRLGRHGDRTADLPYLGDESARDLDGFGLKCAERASASTVAQELIHLAR